MFSFHSLLILDASWKRIYLFKFDLNQANVITLQQDHIARNFAWLYN